MNIEESIDNTEKILNELNYFVKSSNLKKNDSIPIDWYFKLLLEYLKKLPVYLSKNDHEEFYNELERDINKSIKELDFEVLGVISGKLKYINRKKIYNNKYLEHLEEYQLNHQVMQIIKNYFIPVDIKFEYDDLITYLNISESQFKEKDKNNEDKKKKYEKSNKVSLCINIVNFPNKFPNFVNYQEIGDADILEMQENIKCPEQISKYVNIIQDNLKKNSLDNLDKIIDKIRDYIMDKLYDKIYPIEPSKEDNKIYQKSILLSWTRLNHFIKTEEDFDLGNFEKDSLVYFNLLDSEKSPREKISNMNRIFNNIELLLRLNEKDELKDNIDYITSISTYIMIKSNPSRIYSNKRFMELYIGDKKNQKEDNNLTVFRYLCDYIPSIKHTELIGVSINEFTKNCNEATREIKL